MFYGLNRDWETLNNFTRLFLTDNAEISIIQIFDDFNSYFFSNFHHLRPVRVGRGSRIIYELFRQLLLDELYGKQSSEPLSFELGMSYLNWGEYYTWLFGDSRTSLRADNFKYT